MYLISAEGYKNPGVHFLGVRKTGEIWSSMKDVNVQVLKTYLIYFQKKYTAFMKQKALEINEFKDKK